MSHRFHIVDVFAERAYAGNPLAVVIGDDLPEPTMQAIAAEMNFSETTFVRARPAADDGYRTRIFTPAREIAFAGHPILGTAWVVRGILAPEATTQVTLNLAVGQVPVTFERTDDRSEVAWFAAPAVDYGDECPRELVATAIGLSPADIDDGSPAQRFSAGTTSLNIIPVRTAAALEKCRLDLLAFAPLAARGFSPLVYVFCRETRDERNDFAARFFFDAHGVREDPASGNAAAFLGHYLLEHRLLPGDALDLAIEQGHATGRPSRVLLRVRTEGGARRVTVGGHVIPVAKGELVD